MKRMIVATLALTQMTGALISLRASAQALPAIMQQPGYEEGKKILERIAGIKVSYDNPFLAKVVEATNRGDRSAAAEEAMKHPDFYNVTVKKMAARMSTRSEALNAPLNDFSAFFIGVTRDNIDARELLKGNFQYRVDPTLLATTTKIEAADFLSIDFLQKSNRHFSSVNRDPAADISKALVYVAGQKVVVPKPDPADANKRIDSIGELPSVDAAGVLSSRQWITEHALAGTNRRPVEFTFREFLCVPISEWADTQASDARIGQDITRFPGSDHNMFQTSCKGCHTGMDGFRGAFAYLDGSDRVNHSSFSYGGAFDNKVKNRMNIDGNRNSDRVKKTAGYYTTDNSWVNYARGPANARLFGWRGSNINEGVGLNSFGTLVSNSERFSQCMVKRVYESTCRNELDLGTKLDYAKRMAARFEQSGYSLKNLFSIVVTSSECGG